MRAVGRGDTGGSLRGGEAVDSHPGFGRTVGGIGDGFAEGGVSAERSRLERRPRGRRIERDWFKTKPSRSSPARGGVSGNGSRRTTVVGFAAAGTTAALKAVDRRPGWGANDGGAPVQVAGRRFRSDPSARPSPRGPRSRAVPSFRPCPCSTPLPRATFAGSTRRFPRAPPRRPGRRRRRRLRASATA